MKTYLYRSIYTLILVLGYPWIKKRLAKETKTPQAWHQRAGIIADFRTREVIWVHCASVGEVNAALPLINQLEKDYPLKVIVVTTMTLTGAQRVKSALPKALHIFLPLDMPWRMEKFLSRLNPELGIIMETEIWPNLLFTCQEMRIKLIQANGRISPSTFEKYAKYPALIGPALNALSYVAAKSEEDAQRFAYLGLEEDKIQIAGNLKYDIQFADNLDEKVEQLKLQLIKQGVDIDTQPIWVAASTHEGEEEIAIAAHREILKTHPTAVLAIAPRHPERFSQVAGLIRQEDLVLARHSLPDKENKEDVQVYLLDTLGELLYLYKLAKAALVAGSLVPKGGHNLLEPAALGIPVICGPHTEDFPEITQDLQQVGALAVVHSPEQLAQTVATYIADENAAQTSVNAGLGLVKQNRGSLETHLSLIRQLI